MGNGFQRILTEDGYLHDNESHINVKAKCAGVKKESILDPDALLFVIIGLVVQGALIDPIDDELYLRRREFWPALWHFVLDEHVHEQAVIGIPGHNNRTILGTHHDIGIGGHIELFLRASFAAMACYTAVLDDGLNIVRETDLNRFNGWFFGGHSRICRNGRVGGRWRVCWGFGCGNRFPGRRGGGGFRGLTSAGG